MRPSPAFRRASAAIAGAIILAATAGCGSASSPNASNSAESSPVGSTAVTASEAGAQVQALDPGGLAAGTRYTIESLGISVQPDVDGWFAVMPQGGDVAISREDVTVYFLIPTSLLGADGTRVEAPSDPEELLALVDETSIVQMVANEPFEANGFSGINADLEASGGGPDLTLLTTGSGEYGLISGATQWIVADVEGEPVVISIERPDGPDIEAAWQVAGPLIESLDLAP